MLVSDQQLISPPSRYAKLLRPLARRIFHQVLGAQELQPEQARKRLNWVGKMSRPLKGLRRIDAEIPGVKAQWLQAKSAKASDPIVLYLHGGAYVSGSIQSHWELAGRLALAAKSRCLIIDYRLAPEHPYPAALEDAVAAWNWLLEQGHSAKQIIIAGDSAGGGLTLATALKLRELGHEPAAGLYCLSPWADMSLSGESVQTKQDTEVVLTNPQMLVNARRDYADALDWRDPMLSPLFAELHGLPPLLLHVGSEEVLLDDATRLHQQYCQAGNISKLRIWSGLWHVWPIFASMGLPEARDALADAGSFIRQCTQYDASS